MARQGTFIYNVYIADGFYDDCEELIHRCKKFDLLTYRAFCNIWKEMNFASMYKGRIIAAEIAELTEETLHIAKQYMVADTSNFEESVAGVFLVYALLNLQPFRGFAALRLIPEDMPALKRLEVVSRQEKRYDVLYCLGAILVRGPRQCHAASRERGMEAAIRKYLEGFTSIDQQGVRPKGVFYRQNEELDIMRDLKNLSLKYSQSKAALKGNKRQEDRNLSYTDENLASNLQTSLKRIINGLISDNEDSDRHLNAVHAIKMKAMKNVNTMRHRIAVGDRTPSPKKKGHSEADDNKKKSSPKASTSGTPRKRKNSSKKRRKTKKYKKIHDISSDDSDELTLASDGIEETNIQEANIQETNIEETRDDINEKPRDGEETASKINIDDLVDIEIDTLPVFIKTAEGDRDQLIEIEIIDQYGKNNDIIELDEAEMDIEAKLEALKDVDVTRIYDTSIKPSKEVPKVVKHTETTDSHTEMAQISKVNEHVFKMPKRTYYRGKLKNSEKGHSKKTLSKSRFKRMGMLSVPNLNENSQKK